MEKLLTKFIKKLSKDKTLLNSFKKLAIDACQYELAAQLRDIEKENFPESEEVKTAKEQGRKYNTLFRMVDLNIAPDISWLIFKTVEKYRRRRGNFDMRDASNLLVQKEKLFN